MAVEPTVAAIVLTGGASSRMGRHKPALEVGGRPIVRRVLDAVRPWPVVVVGSGEAVPAGVPVVSEEPPGGGPVAGIAVGLAALRGSTPMPYAAGLAPSAPDVVVVLAGDLPLVTRGLLEALVSVARGGPGRPAAVAVSDSGDGPNWLCAAWPGRLLEERIAALDEVGGTSGVSVRRLLEGVEVRRVADAEDAGVDVDTPEDLAQVRRRASGR